MQMWGNLEIAFLKVGNRIVTGKWCRLGDRGPVTLVVCHGHLGACEDPEEKLVPDARIRWSLQSSRLLRQWELSRTTLYVLGLGPSKGMVIMRWARMLRPWKPLPRRAGSNFRITLQR